jgi:hypothetical protein
MKRLTNSRPNTPLRYTTLVAEIFSKEPEEIHCPCGELTLTPEITGPADHRTAQKTGQIPVTK